MCAVVAFTNKRRGGRYVSFALLEVARWRSVVSQDGLCCVDGGDGLRCERLRRHLLLLGHGNEGITIRTRTVRWTGKNGDERSVPWQVWLPLPL